MGGKKWRDLDPPKPKPPPKPRWRPALCFPDVLVPVKKPRKKRYGIKPLRKQKPKVRPDKKGNFMSDLTTPKKPLPPLEVGIAYRAQELVSFQYLGARLTTDNTPILRLDLKNETTLDLPTTDDESKRLMRALIAAFPQDALEFVKAQPWFAASINSLESEEQPQQQT